MIGQHYAELLYKFYLQLNNLLLFSITVLQYQLLVCHKHYNHHYITITSSLHHHYCYMQGSTCLFDWWEVTVPRKVALRSCLTVLGGQSATCFGTTETPELCAGSQATPVWEPFTTSASPQDMVSRWIVAARLIVATLCMYLKIQCTFIVFNIEDILKIRYIHNLFCDESTTFHTLS